MIQLGVSAREGQRALERYMAILGQLESALDEQPLFHTRLRELCFELDVDVAARATVEGRARMSEIEEVVVEPLLRHLRTQLIEERVTSAPPLHTRTVLRALQTEIGVGLVQLREAAEGDDASRS